MSEADLSTDLETGAAAKADARADIRQLEQFRKQGLGQYGMGQTSHMHH